MKKIKAHQRKLMNIINSKGSDIQKLSSLMSLILEMKENMNVLSYEEKRAQSIMMARTINSLN